MTSSPLGALSARSLPAGTALLLRLALRRDRWLAAAGVLVLVGTCYASAAATPDLYPSPAEQRAAAESLDASPAVVALYGPVLDPGSLGELAMTKTTVLYAALLALLLVVLVQRHTRAEEEAGRAELVAGAGASRSAPVLAAVLAGSLVALVLGVLAAAVDVLAGLPTGGSVLFGASWTGTGLVAVGLGALVCQLSASSRTCTAVAGAGVGGLYVVRAVGDTAVPWLGWVTPFGWSTRLRAWSDPRAWVLLLHLGTALALVALALWLRARRDLGSGLVAARPGPAGAGTWLRGPLGLAARLQRPALVGWSVALASVALLLGAASPQVGDLLDSPAARRLVGRLGGEGALRDALLAAELSVVAVLVSGFAVAVVARAVSDEQAGRTQLLLAAVPRRRVLLASLVVALLGATWLLLLTGVSLTLGVALTGSSDGGHLVAASLAQAPAVWVAGAAVGAVHGLHRGWAAAGWLLLLGWVTLGQLGELLRLPARALDLSPYSHVPRMPAEPFSVAGPLGLTLVAVALVVLAVLTHARRDVG